MEGEGERRDMRKKRLNGRGHKIIKRQKAMTLFTFKPNSLIKGSLTWFYFYSYSISNPDGSAGGGAVR